MKCKWVVGAAVVVALGVLDLKCKGTVYNMLPPHVQQQVDTYLQS